MQKLLNSEHNFWLAKPYTLANEKLYYIQMLRNIEKSEEQDYERSENGWWTRTQDW